MIFPAKYLIAATFSLLGVGVALVGTSVAGAQDQNPRLEDLQFREGEAERFFAYSVSTEPGTRVIGVPFDRGNGLDSGSVYVYKLNEDDTYSSTRLTPSDGAQGLQFGKSVAVHNGTVVVGSDHHEENAPLIGAAYVFTPNQVGGYDETKLLPSDRPNSAIFGGSVAIHNDTIVVGASNAFTSGLTRGGAAYVYTPDGTGGYTETKLIASDGAQEDEFGIDVDIFDDTVVVGARSDDDIGIRSGSAYVYTRNGQGDYSEWKLVALTGVESTNYFGESVAIHGSTIAVGSSQARKVGGNHNGLPAGAVYVYQDDGQGGFSETRLVPTDLRAQDYFGSSVAVFDDTVVVGASNAERYQGASGAAYIFTKNVAGGYSQTTLAASDTNGADFFGHSVDISEDAVIVGAYGSNFGAAYIYDRYPSALGVCSSGIAVGDLGWGIGAQDQAVGIGYLMWSSQPVQDRFNPGPGSRDAKHFVPIKWNGTDWEYDDNNNYHPFTPQPDDCLLAEVNFKTNTVDPLVNIPGLTIHPEQVADKPNAGEFQIITEPSPAIPTCTADIELGDLGLGVGADDLARGLGYMMWSSQPVQDRFDPGPGTQNADHFIPARWNGAEWEYDNNNHPYHPFAPTATDCLYAALDYTDNTATPVINIPGLTIHPEQWADQPAGGEFQLTTIG